MDRSFEPEGGMCSPTLGFEGNGVFTIRTFYRYAVRGSQNRLCAFASGSALGFYTSQIVLQIIPLDEGFRSKECLNGGSTI